MTTVEPVDMVPIHKRLIKLSYLNDLSLCTEVYRRVESELNVFLVFPVKDVDGAGYDLRAEVFVDQNFYNPTRP